MEIGNPIEVAIWENEWGECTNVETAVREWAQYDVVAGALQETKWFICRKYEVGNGIVLT